MIYEDDMWFSIKFNEEYLYINETCIPKTDFNENNFILLKLNFVLKCFSLCL